MEHKEVLETIYQKALSSGDSYKPELTADTIEQIELLVERSEANKGLLAVLTTLLTHKIVKPEQDIRYHQQQLPNGFAGRTIDSTIVTPFMKSVRFPAMSESGWLTRSLEQPLPYTLDYPGKITPENVKEAFLQLIDKVQTQEMSPENILLYMFVLLLRQRDKMNIELAKPHSFSISAIVEIMERHFTFDYPCSGAARLPVLAIYAAYQCMMEQVARYEGKTLCPLESHTSADKRSDRIGDIDINYANGEAFEGVEIKHEKQITGQLVTDAYEKFKVFRTDRYYLLTTANMDNADWESINKEIKRIANVHGCQVIVNGVYTTLKYYLRLLRDPADFIDRYVELLKTDEALKFAHKDAWNGIVNAGV